MNAIILGAGFGTRLSAVFPKPLLPLVGEKTILDFQIEKISKYIPIEKIIVVVGYKKELLMERFPDLTYVYNENYARTNTGKSLLKAVKIVEDDLLWLNGDVYFDDEVIPLILKRGKSSILVDHKKCGEEEVKYCLSKDGFITEISKSVKTPLGESLGVNFIEKKHLQKFRDSLSEIDDNDYFEKAVELMIKNNDVKFLPTDIGNCYCSEIDFPEDLEKVKQYINNLK